MWWSTGRTWRTACGRWSAAGSLKHGIDAIGGAATGRLAACLGGGGTVVNYGLLSGEACQISGGDLVFRGIQLRGFWVGRWLQTTPREEIAAAFADLIGLLAAGELTTPIEATYPLSQVREALAHAAREGRDGKVILRAD
jgi:trans-2-enoyl-CoA reductase